LVSAEAFLLPCGQLLSIHIHSCVPIRGGDSKELQNFFFFARALILLDKSPTLMSSLKVIYFFQGFGYSQSLWGEASTYEFFGGEHNSIHNNINA
jgi:hypothetical protein